jgi:hypothetical protein
MASRRGKMVTDRIVGGKCGFFCMVAARADTCTVEHGATLLAACSDIAAWVPLGPGKRESFVVSGGAEWSNFFGAGDLSLSVIGGGLRVGDGKNNILFPPVRGKLGVGLPRELGKGGGSASWLFGWGGVSSGKGGVGLSVDGRVATLEDGEGGARLLVEDSSFSVRLSLDPWVARVLLAFAAAGRGFSLEFYGGARGPFVARSAVGGVLFSSNLGNL